MLIDRPKANSNKKRNTMKIKEKRTIHKEDGAEEIIRYDENGNEIYHKVLGEEIWATYNELGKITSQRSLKNTGKEYWSKYEYDEKGNEIRFEDSDGNLRETRYDEKGLIVYSKDNGKEYFYQHDEDGKKMVCEDVNKTQKITTHYDKNDNLIYSKVQEKETWNTYDEFGNVIKEHSKDIEGNEYWAEREYDEKGNLTKFRDSLGEEAWYEYEYDEAGHIISRKDNEGNFQESRFDAHGNLLYSKDNNDEYEYERKYDDKGNMIYTKYLHNKKMVLEHWFEYDAYGNQILRKDSDFGETTIIDYTYYPE